MLTYMLGSLPSFELLHFQGSNLISNMALPNTLHGSQSNTLHGFLHGSLPNTLHGSLPNILHDSFHDFLHDSLLSTLHSQQFIQIDD